jgi:hypothetical protein
VATGYKIDDGRDLFDLFEPGDAGIVTGYRDAAGVDLGAQFLPIAQGGPLGRNTGYRAVTTAADFAALFAAKGSAKTVWIGGTLKVGRDVSGQVYGYGSGISNPAGVWTQQVNNTTPGLKNVSNISYGISTQTSSFTTSPGGILAPGLFDCKFAWRIAGVDYTAFGSINTSGTYVIGSPTQAFSSFQIAYANSETFPFEVQGDPVTVQPGELYPMRQTGTQYIGYNPPYTGLINPTTINGQSIYYFYQHDDGYVTIAMSGNPPQNLFNSIVCNGVSLPSGAAEFFPYYDDGEGGGNAATWRWNGYALNLTNKVKVPFTYS